jgi:hypothetical protein
MQTTFLLQNKAHPLVHDTARFPGHLAVLHALPTNSVRNVPGSICQPSPRFAPHPSPGWKPCVRNISKNKRRRRDTCCVSRNRLLTSLIRPMPKNSSASLSTESPVLELPANCTCVQANFPSSHATVGNGAQRQQRTQKEPRQNSPRDAVEPRRRAPFAFPKRNAAPSFSPAPQHRPTSNNSQSATPRTKVSSNHITFYRNRLTYSPFSNRECAIKTHRNSYKNQPTKNF